MLDNEKKNKITYNLKAIAPYGFIRKLILK